MNADPLLLRAIEAHKGGRLAEAEVGYRRVLRRRPHDADALNFLGMLRFHRGDPAAAAELLQKAVQALPTNPHAWVNLGNVLLARDDAEGAKAALVKATELAPELPMAWFNLGVCLRRFKLPHDAASCFHQALKLEPGYGPAYDALGVLLYRLGRYDEAASVYRDWLTYHPGDPIARHMLAAVTGENAPVRADDAYVTATFDKFAESFDENLQELGYRAPQLLAERLGALAEKAATLDVLDAGCGTGLCGPLLRPFARTLAGVDLSPGMVQRARAREVYDELAVQELCAFMRSRPASFDLVISADTLCYFGALEEPLAAARECLRRDGWLAFTLERLEPAAAGDYRIEPHGRYSHDEAYVCRALAAAGFVNCEATHASLRRERGADVQGILASASAT